MRSVPTNDKDKLEKRSKRKIAFGALEAFGVGAAVFDQRWEAFAAHYLRCRFEVTDSDF